jgi:uncharacterized protein
MSKDDMYHEGSRDLQDRFDTRRIADRLVEVTLHDAFDEGDRELIESAPMFFLATADAEGRPEVSYKGGMPGFVRVVGEDTLAFPNYDGNGMYRSMGNLLVNANVGLLFIKWGQQPFRIRVQGTASIDRNDPLLSEFPGAQFMVRVKAEKIFPNCPRYIHKMELTEYSAFAPRDDYRPPVPEWKKMKVFNDALPQRDLDDPRCAAEG